MSVKTSSNSLNRNHKGLEQRADKICDNFEGLLVLESQVRKDIPELAPYTLAKLGELKE